MRRCIRPCGRTASWVGAALAACALGCAGSPAPRAGGSERAGAAGAVAAGGAGTVCGTVIDDKSNLPLGGRSVVIGALRTVTDDGGRFSVPNVPAVYDLVVVDPDGTTVSVYQGLHRRDLRVRHQRSANDHVQQPRTARVSGTLAGGPSWPLGKQDLAGVWVVSALARGNALLGGAIAPFGGPSFGPMYLRWDGPATLPAQAYAYSTFRPSADAGGASAPVFAYGTQALTLQEGEVSVTVPLQAVTRSAHVTGTVVHDPSSPPTQREVYYALPPWPGVRIPLHSDAPRPRADPSFDFEVPVAEPPGASLCFMAFSSTGDIRRPLVWDNVCGITPGTPVTAVLEEAPRLTSPRAGSRVTPTTTLAWTAFEGGVYRLDLSSGSFGTAAAPNVSVYSAARSMTWPNLSAADVPFPADAEYAFGIVGLGVFASIDDLAGPAGFASAAPPEYRQSYLSPVKAQVSP
jgi:hypothetical protein